MFIRGGNKRECPEGEQAQAQQDAPLVAVSFHEGSRRQGHQEVGDVGHKLDQSALGLRHGEDALEMFIQHVEHSVGKSPQEKEAGDKHEGEQERFTAGGGHEGQALSSHIRRL